MTSVTVDSMEAAGQPSGNFPVIEGATRFSVGTLSWSILPWAVVRTPGFPAAVVERVAEPRLLGEADDLAALRSRAERDRSRLLDGIASARAAADPAALRELRKAERAALQYRPVPRLPETAAAELAELAGQWNSRRADVEAAAAHLGESYERAYDHAISVIAAESAKPSFGHALFISSRGFFDHVWKDGTGLGGPGAPVTKSRRKALRTAARYLRRLTVRCEQTSFFGPVHFVDLVPGGDRDLRLGDPRPETVYAEPSMWLLDRLTRHRDRDTPEADRPVRRHPIFRVDGDRLTRTADGRSRRLSPDAVRVWEALGEHPTVSAAGAALGLPADRVAGCLAELRPALAPWALPSHEVYPFERLLALGDDTLVRQVARWRDSFAATGWPARRAPFLALEEAAAGLGGGAAVGEGRHYADRYVLHEERAHRFSARTVFGARTIEGLRAATEAMLPLAYAAALLRRADARDALRAALAGRRLPLAFAIGMDFPAAEPRYDAFLADLNAACAGRVTDGVIQLSGLDIGALIDRHCAALDPGDAYGTVAGPDWMITGSPGDGTWVLSELHDDGSYLAGAVTRLHPDGGELREEFERRVVDVIDPVDMAAIVSKRRNKFLLPEMPGVSVEIGGVSVKPRARTVPIADVEVAEDGAAVLVGGRRARLYSGDIPSTVHRALAVPALNPVVFDTGARTPRVVIDGTVIQRARWRIDLPGGSHGRAAWELAQDIRRERGLPRRVFVRHPGEPKPLFVDFADVLAVEDVMRLPAARAVVTEMLPDYGDLWWRPDGELMCAEMRTACFAWLDPGVRG